MGRKSSIWKGDDKQEDLIPGTRLPTVASDLGMHQLLDLEAFQGVVNFDRKRSPSASECEIACAVNYCREKGDFYDPRHWRILGSARIEALQRVDPRGVVQVGRHAAKGARRLSCGRGGHPGMGEGMPARAAAAAVRSPPRLRALLEWVVLVHRAVLLGGPCGAGFRAFWGARKSCVLMHDDANRCVDAHDRYLRPSIGPPGERGCGSVSPVPPTGHASFDGGQFLRLVKLDPVAG